MKLISWNVNGIRACVQKGFLDFFREADADIFCIQESKMQEGQLELDLPGYHQYWNYAVRKGYSGTGIFTRISQTLHQIFYMFQLVFFGETCRLIQIIYCFFIRHFYFPLLDTGHNLHPLWSLPHNQLIPEPDFHIPDSGIL